MKKIVTGLLFVLLANFTYAQIFEDMKFGVKGGINYTNIRNIHGDSGSRLGYAIGAMAMKPLGDTNEYYIQAELMYSAKGEKNDTKEGSELYKLDYIDLPILFKPYFSDSDSEFYAVVGPKFSFLITDDIKNKTISGKGYHDDTYNTFDFGIVGGIGFSYLRKFEIDVRYEYGLTDVVKNDASNDLTNNTSNLHMTLSYLF